MNVIYLSWETAHQHGEAWVSHHRLRHRLFIERQAWDVPTYRGLEYDEFDTPAARLIPTTQPYMVAAFWPELVPEPLPRAPSVWEATRFGYDNNLEPEIRRRVVAELICGCQKYGIRNNIASYLSVMPVGIFKHVIAAAGCPVEMLGPVQKIGLFPTAAAYVHVSGEVLNQVRH